MGTFHSDKGDLHGITVVVEAAGASGKGKKVYVGRCDEVGPDAVVLNDADCHEGPDGEAFVARAAAVGFWPKLARVSIPRAEVASLRRLGEMANPS